MHKKPASDSFRTTQSIPPRVGHFIFSVPTCSFSRSTVIPPACLGEHSRPPSFVGPTTSPSNTQSTQSASSFTLAFESLLTNTVKGYPALSVRCLCNKLVIKSDRKSDLTAALTLPNQQGENQKLNQNLINILHEHQFLGCPEVSRGQSKY